MKKLQRFFNKIIVILIYRNDTQLLTYPGKKNRDLFIRQAIFGTVFGTLTGGVFLTGIFIEMDTADAIMGYLPMIGSIAGILVIFAGLIIERLKSRKKYIIVLNIIAKSLIVATVWIPKFVPKNIAPFLMIGCVFLGFSVSSFMGMAINSLLVDVVDEKIRGRYIGVRQIFALIVTATLPVIAGRFLDVSTDRYLTFSILYTIAWFFMWLETHSFAMMKEPTFKPIGKKNLKFRDIILVPIKNKPFMKMMGFLMFFYFTWFLSMSFASVYQIKYLKLSYTFLTIGTTINALLQMLYYPMWGKFLDKYGPVFTRNVAITLYCLHALIYVFLTKETAYVGMVFLWLNASFMGPAWMLGVFNTKYTVIPAEGRSLYDGFYTSVIGITILLGPTIGNVIRNIIINNNVSIVEFSQFRLMFLLTFLMLLGLVISIYVKSKKETNWEKERLVINSLKAKFRRKKI